MRSDRYCKSVHNNFIKNISRTSAVSSTNFRSILIFVSCVVGVLFNISPAPRCIFLGMENAVPISKNTGGKHFVSRRRSPWRDFFLLFLRCLFILDEG